MSPLILIAEDDADIRDLLRLYLEGEGFRVAEAADGAAALEIARERAPDMAILDVMMPEMNGFELTRALRKYSEVPIPRLTLWTSGHSFLDNLFLYDYLYHKGTDVYQMACRLIGGSSISEVQAHYHWTPTYANQICDDLRTIMQEYMDI